MRLAAILALSLTVQHVTPVARADASPPASSRNASDAVLYAAGYLAGQEEATAIAVQIGAPHLPFRVLALIQLNFAAILRVAGLPETGVQFMIGRADAFNVAADLAGEAPFDMEPWL